MIKFNLLNKREDKQNLIIDESAKEGKRNWTLVKKF